MRARFAAIALVALTALAVPVAGCTAWFPDAAAARASNGLSQAATALRMLNSVAERHIDSLDLPTPEQLEQAASVVRDLKEARHAIELAKHAASAEDSQDVRSHLKDALLYMRGATDTLGKLGAEVGEVRSALQFVESFL